MRNQIIAAAAGLALVLLHPVAGHGQQARTRLPVGITLLGADSTTCAGDLSVDSGAEGLNFESRRIGPGEHRVFRVSTENVGWSCVAEERVTASDTMECASGTTYVRIAHYQDDQVVLFECYGQAR